MKAALFGLAILASVVTGRADDSLAKDGWSEAVNGLRARLVFGERHTPSGATISEVYLELHNVSDRGGLMEFDFTARKSVHFEVRTADGKPAPKPLADGPLLLGATFISSADDGGTLSIPITPGGLGYLNLFLGARLVLGGLVSTVDGGAGTPQQPCGFTGPDIPGGDPLTLTLELTTASCRGHRLPPWRESGGRAVR